MQPIDENDALQMAYNGRDNLKESIKDGSKWRFLKMSVDRLSGKLPQLAKLRTMLDAVDKLDISARKYDDLAEIVDLLLALMDSGWVVLVEKHVRYEGEDVLGVYHTMEDAVKAFPELLKSHTLERYHENRWLPEEESATRGAGFVSKEYGDHADIWWTFYWYEVK